MVGKTAAQGDDVVNRLVVLTIGLWLLMPTSAIAATVGFSGSYLEDRTSCGCNPDTYTLTNAPLSEKQIVQVVLDLSGGTAVFDPDGSPFVVLGGSDPYPEKQAC